MHDKTLNVKGQENASEILSEIYLKKRIPNALLFSGSSGTGKHNAAIQFLKLLNNNSTKIILNGIDNLAEPYVKMIFPLPRGKGETNSDTPTSKLSQETLDEIMEGLKQKSKNPYFPINIKKANNIKINSIRAINKLISMSYDDIPYRGIIISDAHKMSVEAQNAFLKNLEEPPEGIIYFLISDKSDSLLTTIKSRCWEINFSPLDNESLSYVLENNFELSQKEFKTVIPFAQGSATNALFLIESNFDEYLNKTILILRYSLGRKYFTAIKEYSMIIENNSVEAYQSIIDLIIIWLSDTVKNKYNFGNYKFGDFQNTIEKFNARFKDVNINSTISKLTEFRDAPNKNVNLNILIMNVIFEISSIGMKLK